MTPKDKKLNKEQLAAVEHKKGPLLVIAGAGTGKTTVITEKIKYLIKNNLANPSEILALTFTEKAASEMENRVEEALPYGYLQMWVLTFHSFCDRVLKEEALHIGLDPRYRLLSEAESIQLLKDNLFKLDLNYFRPLGNPTKFIHDLLAHFSRLQDEDISPKQYLDWVEQKEKNLKNAIEEEQMEVAKWKELAASYFAYDEIKTKEGLMDFGDLIVKTLKLFRERPNILKKYQERFKYILVDEFQDTNYAQNELVKLLAGKNKNLTVVGDDDQSIYRFRGAAVSNIIQFRKDFPQAKVVVLTVNYRSTQEILDRAYSLIQNNNPDRLEVVEKINKKLIAKSKKKGEDVVFLKARKAEDEAEKVAKEISRLTLEEGYDYKDIAILVRANNHADSFVRALSRHGIPYQFLGPGKLFRQPEIVDLISYLKVLDDVSDSVSLYRLLTLDHFKIPGRDLAFLGSYAKRKNLSLFEVCEMIDEISINEDTKSKIKKVLEIIKKHLNLIPKDTAGQILYFFLEETGILSRLVTPDTPEAQSKAANIAKFFEKIKNYESNHDDASVYAVVNWLDLSSEIGESPLAAEIDWSDSNAVNILTVHSAKGLEFPVVFLVNLVSERFPSRDRRETIPIPDELIKEILPQGDYHLEEERRLFYVGMTRAKERLYLTASDFYGDAKREKKISPFVIESLGDVSLNKTSESQENQLSLLDYQPLVNSIAPKREKLYIDYLSYSQIESFRTCPLHYKLKYILKIPTPSSPSQSFGSSVHLALRDFYQLAMKESFASQSKSKLIKAILDIFEKNWISEGYLSKIHERDFFEKGKKYLEEYIKKEFDPSVKTVLTEESFTIPLLVSNYSKRPLKIGGKIDRVDILPDGRIEIIDYKTGANVPTQKQIDKDLQMSFYALAATTLKEKPFGKEPQEIVLSFYYFEDMKKIMTVRTKEELEEVKKEIFDIRDEIENSDFECSGGIFCKSCEFKMFCSPKI
jgi:DNA helicase-2/ATP-dependent DNA helicase PcrA